MNQEAIKLIKNHEGYRATPYMDTLGIQTIGYGRNLKTYPLSEEEKRTILINDGKYSKQEAENWLKDHLEKLERDLKKYAWFNNLDDFHQAIILDMAYNMGVPRLLLFKKMILALNSKDYLGASREMLNSGWAMQVKHRAIRLSQAMAKNEAKSKDEVNV